MDPTIQITHTVTLQAKSGQWVTPDVFVALAEHWAKTQPAVKGETYRRPQRQGRNERCHCGSGKKYKRCHGKDEQ